ncbi:hypothetical protein [Bradyrhizobium sp.]|uniref:hypothetical protein n=1 Tax=Bradyrhizobium sp. TaxID=376 RepID=UPI004037B043
MEPAKAIIAGGARRIGGGIYFNVSPHHAPRFRRENTPEWISFVRHLGGCLHAQVSGTRSPARKHSRITRLGSRCRYSITIDGQNATRRRVEPRAVLVALRSPVRLRTDGVIAAAEAEGSGESLMPGPAASCADPLAFAAKIEARGRHSGMTPQTSSANLTGTK